MAAGTKEELAESKRRLRETSERQESRINTLGRENLCCGNEGHYQRERKNCLHDERCNRWVGL
jgi:hypothetical protein